MKVKLNKMSLVANWSWTLDNNDYCTICMNPFECSCPLCKFSGDDCPPIEGKCGHIFHLHCIYKWLENGTDKCPLDREIWKEKTESRIIKKNIQNEASRVSNNNFNQIPSNEYNNINTNSHQFNEFDFQNNLNNNFINYYPDDEGRIQIEEALNLTSHSQSPGSSHSQ